MKPIAEILLVAVLVSMATGLVFQGRLIRRQTEALSECTDRLTAATPEADAWNCIIDGVGRFDGSIVLASGFGSATLPAGRHICWCSSGRAGEFVSCSTSGSTLTARGVGDSRVMFACSRCK